ncbi:hypothetical protein Tco_0416485 [Tanacetum coccineum]
MRTRSSYNLVGNSSSNPTTSNPRRRNRRRSNQRVEPFTLEDSPVVVMARNRRRSNQRVEPFTLEESPVVTMVDQRTMAELLRAPTEGYAHSLINMMTSDQFFGLEKDNPHDHIRWFN